MVSFIKLLFLLLPSHPRMFSDKHSVLKTPENGLIIEVRLSVMCAVGKRELAFFKLLLCARPFLCTLPSDTHSEMESHLHVFCFPDRE